MLGIVPIYKGEPRSTAYYFAKQSVHFIDQFCISNSIGKVEFRKRLNFYYQICYKELLDPKF